MDAVSARRGLTALALALVALLGLPGVAQADGAARATCLYERWWDDQCPIPWTISKAEEDRETAQHRDRHYTVRRGDTLWRIAVRMYGPGERAGHQWTRVARANHLTGITIRPGQVLLIPRLP